MHHNDPFAARICPHCDGFATVAIDCGSRDAYGNRVITFQDCPACWGWGVVPRISRRQMAASVSR